LPRRARFECELDLSEGTSRCNCSICTKSRFWKGIVKAEAFQLLEGKDALSDYPFGNKTIHHQFCKNCGVKTFGRGHSDELGGDFYAINVACLDVTPETLAQAPIQYEDGLHDHWESAPTETRYL